MVLTLKNRKEYISVHNKTTHRGNQLGFHKGPMHTNSASFSKQQQPSKSQLKREERFFKSAPKASQNPTIENELELLAAIVMTNGRR